MVRRVLAGSACLLVLSAACAHSVYAQTFQGSFTGTVKDESGAVIAGAIVTAAEQDKGLLRNAVTRNDGLYDIALLPPGRYRVTAEKPGFEKTTRGDIQLTVNQQQQIDFTLKVGSQSTTITVEATPGVVDTQTASVGTTIGQTNVDQVPLNGRQFLELALLAPGVVPAPSGSRVSERGEGGAINVNGLEDSMNSYWLDGLDDTSTAVGQYTVAPPLDAVQEFRMETGVYDAKFGAHAGAQVNVVTKSGTNEFHGTAYDFLRNTHLDAQNYFDPSVPPMHRNQFGGTVGGPFEVPGVYDGHDRTFFFLAYEGLQQHQGFFRQAVVPTATERLGDFSDLLACPQPVNLSLFGQPIFGNNLNALVQGGLIPSFDPVGQAFVNLYPAPANANTCGNANYLAQLNQQIAYNTYMGRLDHHWGTKNSVFFRYNVNFDREYEPSGFYVAGPGNVPGYGTNLHNEYQMAGFDWTHTFTPSVFNEFKFGYNRWQIREDNQDEGNPFAQQLGIQGVARSDANQLGIPELTFTGYDSLGSNTTAPETVAVNTFQVADSVTQVHGNHLIEYGADLRSVLRGNSSIDSLIRGQFDFLGAVTGNSIADALLGLPTDWIDGFQEYISGHLGEYDFFGQDTWKVNSKLTLNLGLRYEYKGLTTDKYNRFSNFDFSSTACAPFGLTTGALLVAGTSAAKVECPSVNPQTQATTYVPVGTRNLGGAGDNRALQYPDRHDFAPRLGIAWQPFGDSMTVVRAGFGLFYNQTFGDVYFQKGNNPPFVSITAGNLGAAQQALCVPGQGCQQGQIPVASGALIQEALVGVAAPVYPTMSPFQIDFDDATIQEWSFDLQRELPHSWLIDIGYVGTHGLHLPREVDPNQAMNLTSGGAAALAACQSAFGCPRPYPVLSGFSYTESSGTSIYHGLQTKVEHHYSNGMALIGSYTYSKSIDTVSDPFSNNRDANFPQNSYNLAAERALSDFDFRHRATAGYVYDLPFGYRLWKLENSRANYLIQGWQLSGVFTAESGPHFTPNISENISGANESAVSANPTDRPNLTGSSLYPSSKTPSQWVSPSAFSFPSPFTFGNAGRNILTGQGLNSWDFSVIRRFKLTETRNIEFRGEMFNIFNRANFDIPVREVDSPSFGKILNTVLPVAGNASGGPGDPREVQLALKLTW